MNGGPGDDDDNDNNKALPLAPDPAPAVTAARSFLAPLRDNLYANRLSVASVVLGVGEALFAVIKLGYMKPRGIFLSMLASLYIL